MADTTDMAPTRTPARRRTPAANGARRSPSTRSRTRARSDDIESQVERLREDIGAIAASVGRLAEDKVSEAGSMAKREVKQLARSGQKALDDAQDEFGQLEKQIKDTIREKPLTAVAGAIALGFILAVVSR